MGFHAVKLWQNKTFHCRNQMNIIILITNEKDGSKLSCQVIAVELTTVCKMEMIFCVGLSSLSSALSLNWFCLTTTSNN
jgi:hypothetical protein